MLTDAAPRGPKQASFLESDQLRNLDLPPEGNLTAIASSIESAMEDGTPSSVRRACVHFLAELAAFYEVPTCGVRVLTARPLRVRESGTIELFGDYRADTRLIRVWVRTAVRKEVTSYGTFLSTLCHEFCHHLDVYKYGFPNSWHTRGFYERAGALYHCARGTAPKRLFWTPIAGGRWRINWPRTNRGR